jgi:hypothetical protein
VNGQAWPTLRRTSWVGPNNEKKIKGLKKKGQAIVIFVQIQPILGYFGVFKVHVDFSELSVYWGVYIE